MSALATIVGSLGELSESELRQLYLMVGVRLGIPDVPTGAKPQQKGGGKPPNANKSAAKGGKTSTSGRGNPNRKSQWANHPLYQEYSRLKKVVENQAKEAKTSFNSVDTAESRAYRQAFTQWVEAKHSFRGHGESGQIRSSTGEGNEDEDEVSSDEEEGPTAERRKTSWPGASTSQPTASSPPQSSTEVPQPAVPAGSAGKSSKSSPGKSGASPPGKGKAAAK